MIPQPPKLEDLPSGTVLIAGIGQSTIIADFDFETYSEAGFHWNPKRGRFEEPLNADKKGLPSIGTAAYAQHPSTEVLSMAYDLKDGRGKRLWRPRQPPPLDLFRYLGNGGLLEAWNCAFERWIWEFVCIPKYGFPDLPFNQLRDAMAKARAFGLPGSLDAAGSVLNIKNKKDKDGKRLLTKFSMPRNPTKLDSRKRIHPHDDPNDANALYEYNLKDIAAEAEISSLIPDLIPFELEFWLCDQAINRRGVQLDRVSIFSCLAIVEQAQVKYNGRLQYITEGKVQAASEIQKLRDWMMEFGVSAPQLDEDTINELLKISLPDLVREALLIRKRVGSAAVKKLYSMLNQVTSSGRVHDLFVYHSARTGRAAGSGPQPQNLPNSGPDVLACICCGRHFGLHHDRVCPYCNVKTSHKQVEWNPAAVEDALATISTCNLEHVENIWGNALDAVSGCLRGLFIAAPGKDLICSDYSAIEAVVLAALAGEQWRLDVFNSHGKIYEMSASKITGIPFEDFLKHKADTGQHHPMRKKVGKVAELASGFQGWIGAWKQFGADEFFNDDEIKKAILAWRKASPAIVEFWGGQQRDWIPCYYGLEGAAVQAVMHPGRVFEYRGISYVMRGDILYCKLLSNRFLTYHRPRLLASERRQDTFSLTFEGWNTNPKAGSYGWIRMQTYGGKLTENVVQATARDILAHAIVNLEKRGYPVVLHVHDEIVAEVPEGYGSVAEFETIMSTLPEWAASWPVKANGGWRAKRYAK